MTEANQETLIYSEQDFVQFREWLNFDLNSTTWQGRYRDEFEDFWSCFFVEGLALGQVIDRFAYAIDTLKTGPLNSWFTWLKNNFLIFNFLYKDLSVLELSKQSKVSAPDLSMLLRNFFVDHYPHLDDVIDEYFRIGNMASNNLDLNYSKLRAKTAIEAPSKGPVDEDVMCSLEVTLYDEWKEFLLKMRKDLLHPGFDIEKIRSAASFKRQLSVLVEILVLSISSLLLIWGIKVANELYQKHLSGKITFEEPKFLWLDKDDKFRGKDTYLVQEEVVPEYEEIEDLAQESDKLLREFAQEEEERFHDESDVVITSWDQLPRDFTSVDLEQSEYEEDRKGGYRDTRFGNKIVYRVMMRSVDPLSSREKLNELLGKYQVTQLGKVKPGTFVPGGVYYNLFVPHNFLKEFLAQVMDTGEAILYKSRTRSRNPPGKNKVFIWIKTI